MLTPGMRLGPFEILGPLGAGGMGEVYRARDPRLGRDVAIKVLPPGSSREADRLLRFEQEARAAAALNHPNILAVHDIGRHDESPYIVAEVLEGATLRERLTHEAIPVRKAVEYAVQIARGLAAAHDKGIVHRDLKPENIFVTSDGHVKILDFGLAKLTQKDPAATAVTELPTTPNTNPGLVLGTVGYMAPEQVRGLAADHRADVFALGAILYEMLARQRAFKRDTSADTMTAILKEDPPDLTVGDRHIPPGLARIVDRCLEKSPAARFQSTGDLAFALEALSSHSGAEPAIAATTSTSKTPSRLPWALVAVLGLVSVTAVSFGAFTYFHRTSPDAQATRFFLSPPEGWTLPLQTAQGGALAAVGPLAVSPDGHRVAFVARNASGNNMIWTRSLDTLAAQALPGTEGARSPFWSPDSRSLGFFAQGKLRKVDVSGGPPVALCDAAPGISGAWGDGVIVFSGAGGTPLQQVSAAGGTPSPVTKLGEGEAGHARPSFLPDGRHFVYRATAGPNAPRGPVFVASLGSTERTRLMDVESTNVVYSQRHLLFLREAALMAQPFDPDRLTATGEAFPVAEQIQRFGSPPYGFFSASDAGVLVYQTGVAVGGAQLTWLDRAGMSLATVGSPTAYGDLALSLDGKKAAVSLVDSQRNEDIWLLDLDRDGLPTRFSFDAARDVAPVFSQDGSRVAFASNRKGSTPAARFDLYQKPSNGIGGEEVLAADNLSKIPTSWSPDGRFLLYTLQTNQSFDDVWILPLSGDRKPIPFLQTRFNEGQGQFSPDGRWIAYVSNESGPDEVYVASFQGPGGAPGGKWQVSTSGGTQPRWRGDGKEIFFVSPAPENTLMAATVTARDTGFEVGAIKPLFAVRPSGTPRNSYQVSADGQRFLVNMGPAQSATPTPITVVVNWTAGFKK